MANYVDIEFPFAHMLNFLFLNCPIDFLWDWKGATDMWLNWILKSIATLLVARISKWNDV
jgi:hypothetical protein